MINEAIILAGGQGTRLKSVITDIPKPMAPIQEKPFLSYLLHQCHIAGITHIILSVGYKHEVIQNYYGNKYKGISLSYAIETERLGTGGGIQLALSFCKTTDVLILNGDSYFDLNIAKFIQFHQTKNTSFTMALKPMQNFERYGAVTRDNDVIKAFHEKQFCTNGHINTGIYCLSKSAFLNLEFEKKFSFEDEFLSKYVSLWKFSAYQEDAYFIDIGIPEDYKVAQKKLPELIQL